MASRLVNQILKTALSELFTNTFNQSVNMSLGSDIFSDSNVNLSNLSFRPDIFDAMLCPLRLIWGSLGSLSISGIAEAALGSPLRVNLENMFLLFTVSDNEDAERIHILKKIRIEVLSKTITISLIKNLLKKILGISTSKSSDTKSQRKIIFTAVKQAFKLVKITIKKIHVRLEIKNKSGPYCSSLGITLPLLRVGQDVVSSKKSSTISFDLSRLQVYCDYDCEPYEGSAYSTMQRFIQGWTTEIHTALLLPFDMRMIIAIALDVLDGKITPQITVTLPFIRIACDPRQLEFIRDLMDIIAGANKRKHMVYHLSGLYSYSNPPPLVEDTTGLHILPSLKLGIQRLNFPSETSVPRAFSSSVVLLIKQRHKHTKDWAKHMWRHVVGVILRDLRISKPLGRWRNLVELVWSRKQYSFLYGKILRANATHSNDAVKGKISVDDLVALHEFEMTHNINIILKFRTIALAVYHAQVLCARKRESLKGFLEGGSRLSFLGKKQKDVVTKQSISWSEVIHMMTLVAEEQKGIITFTANQTISKYSKSKIKNISSTPPVKMKSENDAWKRDKTRGESWESAPDKNATIAQDHNGPLLAASGVPNIASLSPTQSIPSEITPSPAAAVNKEDLSPVRCVTASAEQSYGAESKLGLNSSLSGGGEQGNHVQNPLDGAKKAFSFIKRKTNIPSLKESMTNATSTIKDSVQTTKSSLKDSVIKTKSLLRAMDVLDIAGTKDANFTQNSDDGIIGHNSRSVSSDKNDDSFVDSKTSIIEVGSPNPVKKSVASPPPPSRVVSGLASLHLPAIGGDDDSEDETEMNIRELRLGDVTKFNTLLSKALHLTSREDDDNSVDDEGDEDDFSLDENMDATSEEGNIDAYYGYLLEAVRWVIQKHQSPISVALSQAKFLIEKMEFSMRMPVYKNSRRIILSIDVGGTDFSLSLSMSEPTAPHDSKQVHAKAVSGIFVITKLSVMSLAISAHKYKADAISTATSDGPMIGTPIPILVSDSKCAFLNACVLVDIPPTREIDMGIDVQVSMSPIDIMFQKEVVGVFIEPSVKMQLQQCINSVKDIHMLATLIIDPRIMIDSLHRLPSVLLRHNWKVKTSFSVNEQEENHQVTTSLEIESKKVYRPTFLRTTDSQMQDQKRIVSKYLNTKLWHNILSIILPKGLLTCCIYTSQITIDTLSASSIRQFVLIWQKDIYGKALSGPAFANQQDSDILVAYMKNVIKLYGIGGKKRGVTAAQRRATAAVSTKITVDPILIEFSKILEPISRISFKVLGIDISVPVDDDTLCRALALMLAQLIPFYIAPSVMTENRENTLDHNMQAHHSAAVSVNGVDDATKSRSGTDGSIVGTGSEVRENTDVDAVVAMQHTLAEEADAMATDVSQISQIATCSTNNFAFTSKSYLAFTTLSPVNAPFHSWYICDHTEYKTRIGPNYKVYKHKAPSATPMYTPFAVEVIRSNKHEHHYAISTSPGSISYSTSTYDIHIPPMLLVHLPLPPSDTAKSHESDGSCLSLLIFFRINQHICDELKNFVSASPATKLFRNFCEKAPIDGSWAGRLKIITNCLNGKEIGMSMVMRSLNGKPMLAGAGMQFFRGDNYLELDVPTSGSNSTFPKLNMAQIQIGVLIEGREDNELPEVLLGLVGINKIQEKLCRVMA